MGHLKASSEEFVGDIRFRQFAKCIIQRDFRVAVSMNFGQLVLTNIGPPSGV